MSNSVVPEIRRQLEYFSEHAEVCDDLGVFETRQRLSNGAYLTIRYGLRDRGRKPARKQRRRRK